MLLTLLMGLSLTIGQPAPNSPSSPPLNVPQFGTPAPVSTSSPAAVVPASLQAPVPGEEKKANGNGNGNGDKKKEPYPSSIFGASGLTPFFRQQDGPQGKDFFSSLIRAYVKEFRKSDDDTPDDSPPPARRVAPEPWSSPPFPGHEWQGYPLMGVPPSTDVYPLMQAIYDSTEGTTIGDWIKESRIKMYGWVTAGGNYSTANNSNSPTSYWLVPNRLELDQFIIRFERELDSVQTDHIDWGFRSSFLYGIDYRYMTAGGWTSDQLIKNNRLNGFDMTEQYFDLYIPWVVDGMTIRVGRWIACPDIETQFSVDNYMGSHSLLFTYDTYTQTGIMTSYQIGERMMFQAGITAGTDMAPWYRGAIPTGFFAWRWESLDNHDAFYTALNNINNAQYRNVYVDGQFAGHDNFNYLVTTWEHKFNDQCHTKTEAYFMWQRDAFEGGSVSIGSPQSFGGGGGAGKFIPGWSIDYGVLNYTMFAVSKADYFTIRNELWNDPQGERTGFPGLYSSHTIGWSHAFNSCMLFRPEIGFYHDYGGRSFDLGATRNLVMAGFDFTFRF